MPDHAAFLAFLVAALALNFAPGPDMLYVLGRSLGQGRKAGVVSALGIFAGCLVHIAAAALGLAALLQASAIAYNVIRYAGVAYFLYLGARMLLGRNPSLNPGPSVTPNKHARNALSPVGASPPPSKPEPHLHAGRHHQRSQPQGRDVLRGLPAPICEWRPRLSGVSDRGPGIDF